MKIFFSTGCTSSDVFLIPVVNELRRRGHTGEWVGVGGRPLREAGVRLLFETTPFAIIGYFASCMALVRYGARALRMYHKVKHYFRQSQPDLVVLVDNPGLNFVVMDLARQYGIPVLYYIPPETWSLNRWRLRAVAQRATAIACIFPAEQETYQALAGNARWVGHPVVDLMSHVPRPPRFDGKTPTIGLFPGSRKLEVQELMPALRGAAEIIHRRLPDSRFVVCSANDLAASLIRERLADWTVPVELVHQQSQAVLSRCDLLLSCSGTATLEAAIMGVPMVAMYRLRHLVDRALGHFLQIWCGYKYFSLPNFLLNRPVVPELGNQEVNPERVAAEALSLLEDPVRRQAVCSGLAEVRDLLGPPGAISRVADMVEGMLESPTESKRVADRRALVADGV